MGEALEHMVDFVVGNADARVADADVEMGAGGIGGVGLGPGAHAHFALVGELDGVAHKVEEDLPDARLVADETFRGAQLHLAAQGDAFAHGRTFCLPGFVGG